MAANKAKKTVQVAFTLTAEDGARLEGWAEKLDRGKAYIAREALLSTLDRAESGVSGG
jgi:predicted DNA-binding protein